MNELDILGFNPQDLFNREETPHASGNQNIYKPRPADSKTEDGIYHSTIKIIYNPFDVKNSILEQQSYAMQDKDGWFSVVSKLTNNDTSCPIFTAWKKCRYAAEGTVLNEQHKKGIFQKRFSRYVLVQIMEDKNNPDLVGQYMFWKLPKSVYEVINAKMNPSKDSGRAPVPVMDFLFGREIYLEVHPGPDDRNAPERKLREISYMGEISEDIVSCKNPDGSPLLNAEEQVVLDTYVSAMKEVWRSRDPEFRLNKTKEINAQENTKKLGEIYKRVLENIKSFAPNLIEELGYKEWTDEQKARVQNWIDIVLKGEDPATFGNVNTDPNPADDPFGLSSASTPAAAPAAPAPVPVPVEDDTELPF